MSVKAQFLTHHVGNQPQPLPACNLWHIDVPLREAVARHGGDWAADHLDAHGEVAGGELMELGDLANRHKPSFLPFDRHGRRIDHVEFHPAYHAVMRHAMAAGVHAFSWRMKIALVHMWCAPR